MFRSIIQTILLLIYFAFPKAYAENIQAIYQSAVIAYQEQNYAQAFQLLGSVLNLNGNE